MRNGYHVCGEARSKKVVEGQFGGELKLKLDSLSFPK